MDTSSALDTNEIIEAITSTDLNPMQHLEKMLESFASEVVAIAPKLISVAVVMLIGVVIIRIFIKLIEKAWIKVPIDVPLHRFTISTIKITLYVLLAVTGTGMLGIPITSVITALGAVGLAVSLAVKDGLTNVAGGISILISKPFIIGNFVDISGKSGTIDNIGLVYTVMKTIDNKRICIPNGDVAKADITNFTAEPVRRLDLIFSIGYHDSFPLAQSIILDIINASPYALKDPEPLVRMLAHGGHAIQITSRVWVKSQDYWSLHFDMHEMVKEQFDKAGITIPFDQLEVHLNQPLEPDSPPIRS